MLGETDPELWEEPMTALTRIALAATLVILAGCARVGELDRREHQRDVSRVLRQ